MKFATALAIFSVAAATTVSAQPATNGERMARGLPPLPPVRRHPTAVAGARRTSPSNVPSSCNTGSIQCCESVTTAADPIASVLIGLLGIAGLAETTPVGVTCSPLSVVGLSSSSCTQQPVCCDNNNFNGIVALGCSPININV